MSIKDRIITASAVAAGAALMYLLDGASGARRRAELRDKLVSFSRMGTRKANVAARDVAHRLEGAWAEAGHLFKNEVASDDMLSERVRSQLGRVVSHAHSVEVTAPDGCITLRGSVPDGERDQLLRRVHRVRGVRMVLDKLRAA